MLATRLRTLLLAALLAIAVVGTVAARADASCLTTNANIVSPSCFEAGDGNLIPDNTGLGFTDWSSFMGTVVGGAHNGARIPIPGVSDGTGTTDSAFGAGDAENDPGSWDLGPHSNQGKSDVLAAVTKSETVNPALPPPDIFLYAAFERATNNGNADLAFELNSNPGTYVNSHGSSVPIRTTGDLLITFDGNAGNIRIGMCKWYGDRFGTSSAAADAANFGWYTLPGHGAGGTKIGGSNKDCTDVTRTTLNPTGQALGGMNAGPVANHVNANDPTDASLTSKIVSTMDDPIDTQLFGEASVDLSQALKTATDPGPCFDFGSIWMHSRASSEVTSNMSDYVAPSAIRGAASCEITVDKKEAVKKAGAASDPVASDYSDGPVTASAGDTLFYTMAITNSGTQTVALDSVADPRCNLSPTFNPTTDIPAADKLHPTTADPGALDGSPSTFDSGDVWTARCTHVLAGADANPYVNNVDVVGHVGAPPATACTTTSALPCVHGSDSVSAAQGAVLTINKVSDPASSLQTFGFTTSGAGLSNFTLDGNGDAGDGVDSSKAFAITSFGDKIVSETDQPGWDLSSLVCTGKTATFGTWNGTTFTADSVGGGTAWHAGDTAVKLNLQSGDSATCTFTNSQHASLQITKASDPASSTATFGFTTNGLTPANPTLDGNGDAGDGVDSSKSWDLGASAFGTKVVSEDSKTGWDLSDLSCGGKTVTFGTYNGTTFTPDTDNSGHTWNAGDNAFSVTLGAGDSVQCTFINTQHASLSITKAADPSSSTATFDFTTDGLTPPDATLDGNGDAGDGVESTKSWNLSAADLGTKIVSEDAKTNWDLTDLVCTGATVTFGSYNGTNFTADGSTWQSGDNAFRVTVTAGQAISCTFSNTQHASLQINKVADPSNSSASFGFTTDGLTPPDATLDGNGNAGDGVDSSKSWNLAAADLGTKIVSEDSKTGWDLSGLTCSGTTVTFGSYDGSAFTADGSTWKAGDNAFRVAMAAGDSVDCTFTNTQHAAALVTKVADPVDSGATFDFTTSSLTPADPTLDGNGSAGDGTPSSQSWDLGSSQLGTKIVSEDSKPGWDLTGIDCGQANVTFGSYDGTTFTPDGATWHSGDNAFRVTVTAGQTISCTFSNTQHASLEINKVSAPASSAATFDYTTDGLTPTNPTLDGNGNAGDGTPSTQSWDLGAAQLGTKIVSEDSKAGWDLTNLTCTGATVTFGSYDGTTFSADGATWNAGDNAFRVTITAGNNVSCTFTNTQRGSVTIKKVNSGGDPGDSFSFTPSRQLGAADFPLKGGDQKTFSDLTPDTSGAYTVGESAATGYRLSSIACSDNDSTSSGSTATIRVGPGEDVTCTFTNTAVHPQIAASKSGPATATAGDLVPYTITVTNPTADVPLHNVTVADPRCTTAVTLQSQSTSNGSPDTDNILNPGDVWVYVCSVQTASSDQRVDNVATACGSDEFDRQVCDPAPASTVLAQQVVAGERVVAGEAHIAGKTGCVARAFNVKISGRQIERAVIRIDGKRRAVLHPKVAGQKLVFRVNPRKFKAGSHLLTAKTFFVSASNTPAKTMKLRFARCVRRTAPAFTG